ncbi:hypothetical protein Micbo1qcDRAFT_222219 [Microdochium bolleyi]|uniref:MADS-box domain-containing protein n=1 Tax=Microdochium bolleyi TaxID=196109 RepID=A0A136IKL4_9PEZI|nr:hypothetical protein Micbo1qcDRAFT_222219 [Microdochium bolleyi]
MASRGRLAASGSPVPATRFNHTHPGRAPTKEDEWFASERRKLVRGAQKVAEDFKSNVFLIVRRNGRLYLYTSEPRNAEWPPGPQDIINYPVCPEVISPDDFEDGRPLSRRRSA